MLSDEEKYVEYRNATRRPTWTMEDYYRQDNEIRDRLGLPRDPMAKAYVIEYRFDGAASADSV